MQWDDLAREVWTIRTEKREKGNAGELVLPQAALDVLDERGEGGLVFPGRGGKQISGWSVYKRRLDKASGVSGWVLHDLRRTARTLMSRAGVQSEVAERVMGHAIVGVEGAYNRHDYREEMAQALKKLAGLVQLILSDNKGAVIHLAC